MLVSNQTVARAPSPRRVFLTGAFVAVALATTAGPALAASQDWEGDGGNNLWTNPANWEGNALPGVNDDAFFRSASPGGTINLNGTTQAVDQMRFFTTIDHTFSNGTLELHSQDIPNTFSEAAFSVTKFPATEPVTTHTINTNIRIQANSEWRMDFETALVVNGRLLHTLGTTRNLTKSGPGKLTLAGDNSDFDGDITVAEGTLEAGVNDSLGGATHVEVDAGATLRMVGAEAFGSIGGFGNVVLDAGIAIGDNGRNETFQGTLSGAGAFSLRGGVEFFIAGPTDNTNTGLVTVRNGTLKLFKQVGVDAMAGDLDIGDGGAARSAIVEQGRSNNLPDDTVVDIKVDGFWDMSPEGSTASVVETISQLQGVGAVALDSLTVGSGTYNGTLEDSSAIGGGQLTKTGTDTLTLTGNNTYTGGTRINGGVVAISENTNLGANSSTVIFAGGAIRVSSPAVELGFPTARAFVTADADAVFEITSGLNVIIDGQLSGNGGLVKNGPGRLQLRSTAATYTGPTTVNEGQLQTNAAERLPDNTDLTINSGASWTTFGGTETIDTLNGTGSISFGTDVHLILGADDGNGNFEGSIGESGNAGRLTKTGSGTQILSGSNPNTYTGLTTINNGTLELSKDDGVDAVGGHINVGNGFGGLAVLTQSSINQIPDGSVVTVLSNGTWNVSTETVGAISSASDSSVINLGNLTLSGLGQGTILYRGVLQGAGTFTKEGASFVLNLRGSAANTNTGLTTVKEGILQLGKVASVDAVGGDVQIGDGIGGPSTALLTQFTDHQIPDTSIVEVLSDGRWSLNLDTETVGGITGDGQITLGDLTVNVADAAALEFTGTLKGVGSFTKDGAGQQTLSGNNIYTGGTVVAAGKLVVDTDSLPADNGVTNNATLEFNQETDETYHGRIFGAGKLVKSGSGVLTLANTGRYTGGTDITEGTLKIDPFHDSLPNRGTVTISNGATLDLDGNFEIIGGLAGGGSVAFGSDGHLLARDDDSSATFSGSFSGSGIFTKFGTETMSLTGDNSEFTGDMEILKGILEVGAFNDTVEIDTAVKIADGATLRVTDDGESFGSLSGAGNAVIDGVEMEVGFNGDDTEFSGQVSGTGIFRKFGAGTMKFTGDVDVDIMTVDGGSAHFNGGSLTTAENLVVGLSSTAAVTIDNGATVNAGDFAIVGVRDNSDGTLIVDGDGTTLNAANVLRAGNTQNSVGTIEIRNGADVIAGIVDIAPFGSSSGTLIVDGDGTTLTATNGLDVGFDSMGEAKLTVRNGGRVDVSPDLVVANGGVVELMGGEINTASFVVNSGGSFDFTGGTLHVDTFDGDLNNQGGTVAPGNSPGITNVTGDYNQSAGALAIELAGLGGAGAANGHDQMTITRNASLGGTLDVALINGFTPTHGQVSTILTAGEVVGGFDDFAGDVFTVDVDLALVPVVDHDADEVRLVATYPGDANLDVTVDAADLNELALNWQQDVTGWHHGDFNNDGFVNAGDLNLIALNWQSGVAAGASLTSFEDALAEAFSSSIPEPGTMTGLGVGGLLSLMRRSRRDVPIAS